MLIEKNEDGSYIFYEPLARLPYKGTGWVVIFHSDGKQPLALKQLKNGVQHGISTVWYDNGQKESQGNYKEGKKNGELIRWYKNGQKMAEGTYKNGVPEGLIIVWHQNGQKKEKANWIGGKLDGVVTVWYENGQKEGEGIFKLGQIISSTKWKPNGEICPVTNVKNGSGISVSYNMDGTEKRRITYIKNQNMTEGKKSNSLVHDLTPEVNQVRKDHQKEPELVTLSKDNSHLLPEWSDFKYNSIEEKVFWDSLPDWTVQMASQSFKPWLRDHPRRSPEGLLIEKPTSLLPKKLSSNEHSRDSLKTSPGYSGLVKRKISYARDSGQKGFHRIIYEFKDGWMVRQKSWNLEGSIVSDGFYINGKYEGSWTSWDENGKSLIKKFKNGTQLDEVQLSNRKPIFHFNP